MLLPTIVVTKSGKIIQELTVTFCDGTEPVNEFQCQVNAAM